MAGAAANGVKQEPGEEHAMQQNGSKLTAAQRKKLKKKEREKAKKAARASRTNKEEASAGGTTVKSEEVVVEYVSAPHELEDMLVNQSVKHEDDTTRPGVSAALAAVEAAKTVPLHLFRLRSITTTHQAAALADIKRIYERFASAEEVTGAVVREDVDSDDENGQPGEDAAAPRTDPASDAENSDGEQGGAASKKKLRMARQLKVAELKKECERPEVVEMWDVTAADPKLLVYLKAYRCTVPVPRHWSQKRAYLAGKRGLEKPAFKLPDYIEATGIGEMRASYHAKEGDKKMKQKMRDRMQPKMGKLDIDYAILHDAFFKHQRPPTMSSWGELYYEGKEFEPNYKNRKPGHLSQGLQEALGMIPGHPPPWLINMQRYGPPPSYPDLKIPGLNSPIPPGGQFGYHPGGWGKPPVDEHGNPVYGNVFGAWEENEETDDEVDKHTHFGDVTVELESSSEEEGEEEEDDDEAEEEPRAADEVAHTAEEEAAGLASVASGISSMAGGLETPDVVDLRKRAGITTPLNAPAVLPPGQLYAVLEQKQVNVGQGILGTEHVYVVPGAGEDLSRTVGAAAQKRLEALRQSMPDVEVTISPEELDTLDDAALRQLYETRARQAGGREDLSDMVAQQAAAQKRKAGKLEKDKAEKKFKF